MAEHAPKRGGGKGSRSKGRRGQTAAMNILRDRDWTVVDTSSGMACEDGFCIDPLGVAWAVEVKNTQSITTAHRRQAMAQAKNRRVNWMLMSKIEGSPCWLVQRKGMKPTVWSEKETQDDA